MAKEVHKLMKYILTYGIFPMATVVWISLRNRKDQICIIYMCTLIEQDQTSCIPSYESINGSCVRCNIGEYSVGLALFCVDKSVTCPAGQGYEFNIYRDRDHCQNCTEGSYSESWYL